MRYAEKRSVGRSHARRADDLVGGSQEIVGCEENETGRCGDTLERSLYISGWVLVLINGWP